MEPELKKAKQIDHSNILNIDAAVKLRPANRPCAIVTGVSGQTGSYMVEYLLQNTDAEIFGGVRRLSVHNHKNISEINSDRFHLINFDLLDNNTISRIIEKLQPDYFFNFAAQSFVGSSWDYARVTWDTNTIGVMNILEAVRLYVPHCRVYQAGSSEELGDVLYSPQDEHHPMRPRSPYGASKCASRHLIKVWRESYNLYAIQGRLYNHESERRGIEFVTRKISSNVARIRRNFHGEFEPLRLGNLDAKRDWSHAKDFVDGVWKMMNQEIYRPNLHSNSYKVKEFSKSLIDPLKEYILSSNETHTIREFVEKAFLAASINGHWEGHGLQEKYISNDNKILVEIDEQFFRPAEVDLLWGDSTKARKELGWTPKYSFDDLVKCMVEHDIQELT